MRNRPTIGSAMTQEQRLEFRDQLRLARANAQLDAEGFDALFLWLERFGLVLTRRQLGLHKLRPHVEAVVSKSPLAFLVPEAYPDDHLSFTELYAQTKNGRNDAVHEGTYARHLTEQVLHLALILQDALEVGFVNARQFMVRDPICASSWEPLSLLRQKYLTNSFSYLPILDRAVDRWYLVPDASVAKYLRSVDTSTEEGIAERKRRLATPLVEAVERGHVTLVVAETCVPTDPVENLAGRLNERPILVLSESTPRRLLGVLTAFDLL